MKLKYNTLYAIILLITLIILPPHKIVVKILSCANSGRCRVLMSDNTYDLLFNPYVGQIIKIRLDLKK